MGATSGLEGYCTIGSCTPVAVTDCNLNFGSPNEEYFAVSGSGFSETVATAKRGSGTINAVCDEAQLLNSIASSGDLVTLAFFASAATSATGEGRLGQFDWSMNREGTPQRVSIPFITHGVWTGDLVS